MVSFSPFLRPRFSLAARDVACLCHGMGALSLHSASHGERTQQATPPSHSRPRHPHVPCPPSTRLSKRPDARRECVRLPRLDLTLGVCHTYYVYASQMATIASTRAFARPAGVHFGTRAARRATPVRGFAKRDDPPASSRVVFANGARGGHASCSNEDITRSSSEDPKPESGAAKRGAFAKNADYLTAKLANAFVTLAVVACVATPAYVPPALAVETTRPRVSEIEERNATTKSVSIRNDFAKLEAELNKDLRIVSREIEIDKELLERDVERVPVTFEQFIRKEPPILVGMLAIGVINGFVGLTWALFFRETEAGPGGEGACFWLSQIQARRLPPLFDDHSLKGSVLHTSLVHCFISQLVTV